MKPLRVAFMGTPDFALPALEALYKSDHDLVCVYSQPPRPKGRGHKVKLSPVHAFAEDKGIQIFTPKTLRSKKVREKFISHDLDVAVVAAYGLILPPAILAAPKYGCLNIHASFLPRWRGASPIQRAIMAGDKYSGITIMQMDKGLDTGAIIDQSRVLIDDDMTASDLHDVLAKTGGELLLRVLDKMAQRGGALESVKQDESKATYADLLKKEDGVIDWKQPAQQISRQVRALNPWPGTRTECAGKKFKILSVAVESGHTDAEAGTILDRLGRVACGGGSIIKILRLQPEAKQAMDYISALNGGYIDEDKQKFG